MTAISGGSSSNSATPPASISARSPNGLTADRRKTTWSGSPRRGACRRRRRPRRCRRGGRSPRPRSGPAGRRPAALLARAFAVLARPRSRSARTDAAAHGVRMMTPAAAGMPSRRCSATPSPRRASDPPRLPASGGPPQARHPAGREDRAEEVPRGRARAVVAPRLRGARRRARPAARGPDAARDDGRPRARRADRADPDPARRPGHGRRDAGADADRPRSGTSGCSATSGRSSRSSTTTSCPTRRTSTCA